MPDLVLYLDEFTEYQDAHIAKAAAKLLQALNFSFRVVYAPSGRAAISKSMLPLARECAHETLEKLKPFIEKSVPIVGLEPSAVLGFRDDFLKLIPPNYRSQAEALAQLSFTLEEFLFHQQESGKVHSDLFTDKVESVHIQLHCHQKAVSHIKYSKLVLSIPKNYKVLAIPAGCCGMAGSFGYEDEHFELSNKIGELVLFPHIRKNDNALIVAAGTSCRHQILDGVKTKAFHPAEILLAALKQPDNTKR